MIWDFWAKYYNRLWVQKYSLTPTRVCVKNIIRNFGTGEGNFLDMGCGTGQLIKEISEEFSFSNIVGIDLSKEMINRAKEFCRSDLKNTLQKETINEISEQKQKNIQSEYRENAEQNYTDKNNNSNTEEIKKEKMADSNIRNENTESKISDKNICEEKTKNGAEQKNIQSEYRESIKQNSAKNIEFICAGIDDINSLDLPKFRVITCTHSLPYYKNQSKAISDLADQLEENGILIVACGSMNGIWDKIALSLIKITTGLAHYPGIESLKNMSGQKLSVVDIRKIKEKWFVPSIVAVAYKKESIV